MNILLIAAGSTALMTTVGHFTAGSKLYLKPLLDSDIEPIAKKVLHCVFHYVSVFLITSTAALSLSGLNLMPESSPQLLCRFIALNYLAFAVWQLILAGQSGIPKAPIKMFQWTFFIIVAVLAWFGSGKAA